MDETRIACSGCSKEIFRSASPDGKCIACRKALERNPKKDPDSMASADIPDSLTKPGYLSKRLTIPIGVGTTLLLFAFLAITFWQKYFTEEGRLRSVVNEYLSLGGGQEIVEAFEYLTPTSQRIGLENWVEVRQSARAQSSEVVDVVMLNDSQAKVAFFDGARTYSATWKKVDGEWRRAYYEDNQEVLERRFDLSPGGDKFDLVNATYLWDVSQSNLTRQLLYRPQLKFQVRNIGSIPIDRLEFRVQFEDRSDNSLFAEESVYAIGSSDLPLQPKRISQMFFVTSSIGFDLSKTDTIDPDRISTWLKQRRNEISPKLFYRSASSGEWRSYELPPNF